MEKRSKKGKTGRKITFKPLFTIFVPCLKIQDGRGPSLPPAADAHAYFDTTNKKKKEL